MRINNLVENTKLYYELNSIYNNADLMLVKLTVLIKFCFHFRINCNYSNKAFEKFSKKIVLQRMLISKNISNSIIKTLNLKMNKIALKIIFRICETFIKTINK